MNRKSALIQKADPETLKAFADRIAAGEDTQEVLSELAQEASKAPGAIGRIKDRLGDLLSDDAIQFEGGVFSPTKEFTKEDAERIITAVVNLNNDSDAIHNMGRWILGNIGSILEDQGFSIGDMIEPTQLAYSTIAKSIYTFREFKERRFKLPFAHHSEIAYTKDIPKEGKYAILEAAEKEGLPLMLTRKIAKEVIKASAENPEDKDWEVMVEHAKRKALEDKNEARTSAYGIVGAEGLQIVHRTPTPEEMEQAIEVFKIGKFLKERSYDGAGEGAVEGDDEPVEADTPDGGAAHGEDD